jgi:hypothetical protein
MTKEQLKEILDKHELWLGRYPNGVRADLSEANLTGVDLSRTNLAWVNLDGANLSGADLFGADLAKANLSEADLAKANLCDTNLIRAYLFGANLSKANLIGADLREANLYGVNLSEANLTNAKLPNYKILPEEGPFYAYKKVMNTIITLYIPRSAERISSLVGRKCRVSKAKVVKIEFLDDVKTEKLVSNHDNKTEYQLNKWIKPNKFDDDIRIECTSGIHCFITKKEAINYQK